MGSDTIDPRAFRHRLVRLIVMMPLLLGGMATICFWQIGELLLVSAWVERTDRVIARFLDVQKRLVDMEKGAQGYLASGKSELLSHYSEETLAIGTALRDLIDVVNDEPELKSRVAPLRVQHDAWSRYTRKLAEAQEEGNDGYLSLASGAEGSRQIAQMREHIEAVLASQVMMRDQRSQAARIQGQTVIGSVVGVSCFLSILFSFLMTRQLRALSLAYQAALETNQNQQPRTAEERFRLLVEGVEDYAIFLLNSEGCIATWNAGARRFFDYPADEVLGRHFSCLYAQQDRDGKAERDLVTVELEGRMVGIKRFARHDTSTTSLHLTLVAVRGDDGHLLGFSVVLRAISAKEDVRAWPVTEKHELPFDHPAERQPVA